MKKVFSFLLALLMVVTAIIGVIPPIEVSASDNYGTTRYTVLILDTMGEYSIQVGTFETVEVGSSMDNVKNASKKFVEKITQAEGDNHVAIVRCANTSNIACDFSDSETKLKNTINSMAESDSGFSDVNRAFELADSLLSKAPENAICNIVYFSGCTPAGGEYNYQGVYTEEDCTYKVIATGIHLYAHSNVVYNTAQSLSDKGYKIYTLGCVTNLEEQPESYNFFIKVMKDIANSGYYDAKNPEDLEDVFELISYYIINPLILYPSYTSRIDGEELIIDVNAKITNSSSKTSIGSRVKLDEFDGFSVDGSTPKEYILGDIEPQGTRDVKWTIRTVAPVGERKYQIKVVVGSENSVAVEQYLTIEIDTESVRKDFTAEDRWNFPHGDVGCYYIDDPELDFLLSNLNKKTQSLINKKIKEYATETVNTLATPQRKPKWGGSCYGMTLAAWLFNLGRLTPEYWDPNADTIGDLYISDFKQELENNIRSLITYYQLFQYLDQYKSVSKATKKKSVAKCIEELETSVANNPVIFGFCFEGKYTADTTENKKGDKYSGGHAIIICGEPEYNETGWTIDNVVYHYRMQTYDVNDYNKEHPDKYNPSYFFYNKGKECDWTLGSYGIDNQLSIKYFVKYFKDGGECYRFKKKEIVFINNDINSLDCFNIEEKNISNADEINDSIYIIANNLTERIRIADSKGNVSIIDGLTIQSISGNIVGISYYNFLNNDGNPELIIALNLDEEYTIENIGNNENVDLIIELENVNQYINVEKCKTIKLSNTGTIELTESDGSFEITSVYNDGYHTTDWYKTTVSGTDVGNIEMKQTDDGMLVNSDNLQNVSITTQSDTTEFTTSVATVNPSMLITSTDSDDVVVLVDSDNNGEFDTSINDTSSYTITFDANGGIASETTKYTDNSGKLINLPTAERKGYIFKGWFTKIENGVEVTLQTVFDENTTVYAKWEKIQSNQRPNSSTSTPSSSNSGTSSSRGNKIGITPLQITLIVCCYTTIVALLVVIIVMLKRRRR